MYKRKTKGAAPDQHLRESKGACEQILENHMKDLNAQCMQITTGLEYKTVKRKHAKQPCKEPPQAK